MAWRIGVDSGGTFIDVCLFDDSTGRFAVRKVRSTPDDPSRGIAQGIEEAIAQTGADDADATPRLPIRSVAGPSAGVAGALEAARLAGFGAVTSFDMGGGSTHVAQLQAGAGATAAADPGAPEIHSVAAGGDSIAGFGPGGKLQVGPPGAGPEPTVTDAQLVLQTLNPGTLPGGHLKLRQDLASAAIGALAARLGLDMPAAAQAIVSALTTTVAEAIRGLPARHGHDPRDDTLVAFGGAGPLHAARLARELGMARVLVPRHAGVLGAVGELLTDLRADFSAPAVMDLGAEALPAIAEAFGLLRHRAAMWFSGHKIPAGGRCISRSIELRAAGQTGSLSLPLAEGPVTAATLEALAGQFVGTHRPPQGFLAGGGKLQIVAFHVEAVGRVPRPDFRPRPDAGPDASAARAGSRAVWLPEAGGWITCPVYDRDRLDAGNCLTGPAIVEQMDATTLILPGMTARVEPYLGLILQDEA